MTAADTRTPWGSTLITEVVTSLAGVEPPTWMDISDRVSFRELGQITVTNGRQSDLSGDEPAQLSIAFRDDDHLFTVGDILRAGRRIRVRESFGLSTFDLIDAEIQVPTTATAMDLADGSQAEITVSITATDQLGRLREAAKFVSTLAAHIMHNGGSALKAYYPMNDATLPLREARGAYPALGIGRDNTSLSFVSGRPVPPTSNSGTLGADDARVIASSYAWDGTTITGFQPLHSDWTANPLVVTTTQTLTVVAWIRVEHDISIGTLNGSLLPFQTSWDEAGGGVGGLRFEPELAANGNWRALLSSTSFSNSVGTFVGPPIMPGVAYPIALRFNPSGLALEWWVGSTRVVDTSVTGAGVNLSIRDLWAPLRGVSGLIGHLQIYVGAASDWTYQNYLDQYQIGLYGLEGQLTGQRVNTILDYAGVPAGPRDIDPGVATMSVALLGGKDPLTCLEEARRTEQGRLFSVGSFGSRRIQFRDRQRAYNA